MWLLARILPALGVLFPCPASAHAFGARYDLPLPLWLYLTSAAAVVVLSFAVVAATTGNPKSVELGSAEPDARGASGDSSGSPAAYLVRFIGVAIFLLVIFASLFGSPDPFHNVAPTMVWVIWWIGLAYVVAGVGNVWRFINPWTTLFRSAEWAARRLFGRERLSLGYPLPSRLGAWPAVVTFWGFAWIELVSDVGSEPRILGALIIAYSLWTWAGMAMFGVERWVAHGEAFSMFFGLIGRMGLFRFEPGSRESASPIRAPFIGLLLSRPQGLAASAFVLVLLATLTFDGFKETAAWSELLDAIGRSQGLRGGLLTLHGLGLGLVGLIETIALLVFPMLFALLFAAFCAMAAVAGGRVSPSILARHLVVTLVPIAFAYHLAHYVSYLLLAGQLIIPLASDPFGWGWDLFGTAMYRIDLSVIGARAVWYISVGSIVTGHVAAVYLAHRTALVLYRDSTRARRSQYPILVLMVAYTMTSLWILSQPIVNDA